jgi:hypothetical protein
MTGRHFCPRKTPCSRLSDAGFVVDSVVPCRLSCTRKRSPYEYSTKSSSFPEADPEGWR